MKRLIMNKLLKWKESTNRKPLILKGARQVGKTYILKEFGEKYYDNFVYFNFDHDSGLANLFENTKDPKRILDQLILVSGSKIEPHNTLIIFDEIQECPDALNSLKYFNEETNEFHIVCAGSLLGIRLSKTSFPVGKVDFLNLYPMTFTEYLYADGSENLVEYLQSIKNIEPIPEIFEKQLIEKLKIYYIIGGMPEVVNSWVNEKNMERIDYIQQSIIDSYESDFSKHTTNNEANKISLIWNNIPSQLAKENKKYIYQALKSGARAREYEGALNWLNDANLIYKCYNANSDSFPLSSYKDLSSFKIYLGDVGLLRRLSKLDSKIILENNALFEEFKGSFAENFVINNLIYLFDEVPNYFTFDKYEIDFMIQRKNEIIPIEVKSNKSKSHISLKKYNSSKDNRISIKFSIENLKLDGKILNVPLYLIEYLNNLDF